MGLRIGELLEICRAIGLTVPSRATIAEVEMALRQRCAQSGVGMPFAYAPGMPASSGPAPSRGFDPSGAESAAAAPVPPPPPPPEPAAAPAQLGVVWKGTGGQGKAVRTMTVMSDQTLLEALMALW